MPTTDTKNLFEQILETTFTTSQLTRRIRSLRYYITNRLYSPNKAQLPQSINEEDLYWLVELGENFYKNFTKSNTNQILENFYNQAKSTKTFLMYIPFDMPPEEMLALGQKLRQNYAPNLLLDIKHDPELIGGPALIINGKYIDLSMRKKIEDNKNTIVARIREFLHQ